MNAVVFCFVVASPRVVVVQRAAPVPPTLAALIGDADKAFVDSYFEQSANKAHALLNDPRLKKQDLEHVRLLLAYSDYYIGQGQSAESVLGDVFADNPDASIDTARYPPPLVEFFNQVKAKVLKRPELAGIVAEKPPGLHPAWAFTMTGVTVVLLVSGIVEGVISNSAEQSYKSLLAASRNAPVQGSEIVVAEQRAHNNAIAADVLFGVTGASAVATTLLYLFADYRRLPHAPKSVSVGPIGGGGAIFAAWEL